MDPPPLRDDSDRRTALNASPPFAPATNGYPTDPPSVSGYTLMVAGPRTGKTSFLRLLLDTCDVAPTASKDQLASVAKFVQGCSGHTSLIRTASIDIDLDIDGNGSTQRFPLSLVDTPSIDFDDDAAAEHIVSEMLRHVDSRFAEGVEDDWKAQTGDHHVHLCLYFLDPDHIVPPSVPGPPAPLVPRARGNSFSQHDSEPVILEPPVTTNPFLCRPTLPPAEIATIRRLSSRVNVLPVIARADTLTNDRLAAVKLAIRRDLAEAGIGFGIFDIDSHLQYQDGVEHQPSKNGDSYNTLRNGSSSINNSPPTTPGSPSFLRLPYALISPDIYSHSDGVARIPPSRHELVVQYTPMPKHRSSKLIRGRFIRSYRWGSMDVLEPTHSDFLPLRAAIFHHMETLQKYTREYLFDKFRADYLHHHHPVSHHSLSRHSTQGTGTRHHPPSLSHGTRPILAIETAQTHSAISRHPSLSVSRDLPLGNDMRPGPRAAPDASSSNISVRTSPAGTRSSKQRTKKITVACNFCRSRKLKCDGGRPACSQCLKRSNPCDYIVQNKRRGTLRRKVDDESESDSGDENSAELEDPSLSPEVPSLSASRRSSNADVPKVEGYPSSLSAPSERYPEDIKMPSRALRSDPALSRRSPEGSRSYFNDNELPQIATLPVPTSSPSSSMPGPPLPPIRPASEQQAAQRKRAATVPGKSTRQPSNSGPKVVACNFCRSRKTKCDGAHPACSSCSRRSLPCSYVHDPPSSNGAAAAAAKKTTRRASTSKLGSMPSASSRSPPSQMTHAAPTSSDAPNGHSHQDAAKDGVADLKRPREDADRAHPSKKMKMEDSPSVVGIP